MEDFITWNKFDPEGKYTVTSNRVEWDHVDRTAWIRVFKDFGEDYIENFECKFAVNFSSIEAGVSTNRLIIHLLSVMNDIANQISVYAHQFGDTDNKWRIVFFQRKERNNVFVFIGNIEFTTNKLYYIKVTRMDNICRVIVYDDVDEMIILEDSGDKTGIIDKYRYVAVARGIDNPVDREDWSSGYIENLEIYRLERVYTSIDVVGEVIPRYDVFIAHYRRSAEDFAEHLKSGLDDIEIPSFLDKRNIPSTVIEFSEEWRRIRDDALRSSKIFLLIITRGFETSDELKQEFILANKENIQKLFFKDQALSYDNLKIRLEGQIIDLSNYQLHEFKTKEELLRKVGYILDELTF